MTTITTLSPEQTRDLEKRAVRVHPDEPVGAAREVLALIKHMRNADAHAVSYAMQSARVRALAEEWIASPDIQLAAAGRILQRTLDGRQAMSGLI